jgi:hypothetical protein
MGAVLAPVRSAPFPIEDIMGSRVSAALEVAVLRHVETHRELRASIAACVDSLHEQGMTPEGTVITMKALIVHLARTAPLLHRDHSIRAADYIMSEVAEWCVAAYFRSP